MTAKFKIAAAAAFFAMGGQALAQDAAHAFDGSALLSKIAARTAIAQEGMTSVVLAAAETRLAPTLAAVEFKPAASGALFAAETPMIKRPFVIASR